MQRDPLSSLYCLMTDETRQPRYPPQAAAPPRVTRPLFVPASSHLSCLWSQTLHFPLGEPQLYPSTHLAPPWPVSLCRSKGASPRAAQVEVCNGARWPRGKRKRANHTLVVRPSSTWLPITRNQKNPRNYPYRSLT